jgi:hypothetical protein
MGREVFGVRVSGHGSDRLRVYAHSAVPDGQSDPGLPGGVALLVLNLDLRRAATLSLPEFRGWRYELFSLTAPDIQGRTVLLNGSELALTAGGDLPHLGGIPQRASGVPRIEVGPLSCAFVLLRPAA